MAKASIFEYLDYLEFIKDFIAGLPNKGRGFKKEMADALNCQMSFITHVFNRDKDFSSEQLYKLSPLFNLNLEESDYLMDLLAYNRAGTVELKKYYLNKLKIKKEEHNLLQKRFKETQELSQTDQLQYYSDWLYGAIHMCSTVPSLQKISTLKKHFNLDGKKLMEIVTFLSNSGLVKFDGQSITPGKTNLYIGKSSPLVTQNHTIWRVKALNDLKHETEEDLHYTLCFSASVEDWPKIREKIVEAIGDCLKIIRPSKEEKIGMLCIDFQEVK